MDELLVHINKLYGLELYSYEKVIKGSLSENHVLVQGSEKFFLKKYRFTDMDRIEEIQSSKRYFSAGGIPVILPLINKEKKTFFSFGGAYFAVFPYITGRHLERGSLTDGAIVSLGEMLGEIHLLGRVANLPIKEKFKGWAKDKVLEKITKIRLEIQKISVLSQFDELALKSLDAKERLILSNPTTYEDLNLPSDHLIHGDYLDHNVFFDEDDKVSHVFDFEKSDYSPRMDELFRSLMYSFLTDGVSDKNISRAKLYLRSYLKIYPASKSEIAKGLRLFYLKSVHSIWIEGEHYLKGNKRVDGFLPGDFRRLQYLSDHFQEFQSKML